MKNDYNRSDFWEIKLDDEQIEYYFRLNNKKIKLEKDVFLVLKNSYRKMLRDYNREEYIDSYDDMDIPFLKMSKRFENNITDQVQKKFLKQKLLQRLDRLPFEEKFIITSIYFEDKSERDLAKLLNIPLSTLHYQKTKILKKLREFFEQDEI